MLNFHGRFYSVLNAVVSVLSENSTEKEINKWMREQVRKYC